MKLSVVIPFALSFGCAAFGFALQQRWEMRIVQRNAELQANVTEAGLKQAWIETLGDGVDRGTVSPGFVVEVDRRAERLLTPFFPERKVELDWQRYRRAKVEAPNVAATFLAAALAKPRSWDRILAITAYHDVFHKFPNTAFVGYEETIVSPEAHRAYQIIFSSLAGQPDFSALGPKARFNGCFVRVAASGNIQAFVPRRDELAAKALLTFATKMSRLAATFGETSLDLNPGTARDDLDGNLKGMPRFLFGASISALFVGLGLVWRLLRDERRQGLRRISFLNQVVHELNTPLAAIKLHAQLMIKSGADQESIHAINEGVGRMARLFAEVSAIHRGDARPLLRMIGPDEWTQLIDDLRRENPAAVVVVGEVQAAISADLARARVVLRNLVQNGLRYGQAVIVTVEDDAKTCHIIVADDGPGVAKNEGRKIFEPFYRSEQATLAVPDGLGLGLSIARKAALEMQAEVTLMNPGQRGAVFRLTFKRGVGSR